MNMQPLAQAIPKVLAELLRAAPASPGKIEFAWKAAVGPAVARVTRVKLEGRLLLVESDTPVWTREVVRSSPVILRRLNNLLGSDAIAGISVRA
jgi:hypothetical protein